jgi:hypothetical protein
MGWRNKNGIKKRNKEEEPGISPEDAEYKSRT